MPWPSVKVSKHSSTRTSEDVRWFASGLQLSPEFATYGQVRIRVEIGFKSAGIASCGQSDTISLPL